MSSGEDCSRFIRHEPRGGIGAARAGRHRMGVCRGMAQDGEAGIPVGLGSTSSQALIVPAPPGAGFTYEIRVAALPKRSSAVLTMPLTTRSAMDLT